MVENDKTEMFIDPSENDKIGAKNIIRVSERWRKIDFLNLMIFRSKGSSIFCLAKSNLIYESNQCARRDLNP